MYYKQWISILTVKQRMCCVECNYDKHFSAIDFHHPEPSIKIHKPSSLLRLKPTPERIEYIMTKTISLCSNCHRILHFNERNK